MFEITRLTVEHLAAGCVTDCSTPRIGFSLSSDRQGAQLADAELTVGDWSAHVTSGQSAASSALRCCLSPPTACA